MAAGWITVVAPYLPEIVRLARPIFTRTPPPLVDLGQQRRNDVVDAQIVELQDAASQNADSIGKLAADMQKTIEALHLAAARAETRLVRAQALALVATTIAVLAFSLAAWALAR
ncbi:hypothetical protein CMZ82_05060 [Lysobacteraceae bacterium NML93-0792]|nr:hypothetical protein CMZ82_05060 [Xanthomonadaceae bacterium NML93-0792]PBS17164.1 hypothetical protein CMZ81_02840 [Xanthomonadaceae bacterium NML93-0793]PBS19582.1 hypothetical protein CMZ80_04815 [Xanthomonadaceae bacterium NML93-0831]